METNFFLGGGGREGGGVDVGWKNETKLLKNLEDTRPLPPQSLTKIIPPFLLNYSCHVTWSETFFS